MNYREAMEYMEQAGQYGVVPGLESVRQLCGRMGNPQESLKFVHIAGTNGKGSVSAFVASVLKCAGCRVGSFSSPALKERESIRVNQVPITQKAFCQGMELVKEVCGGMQKEGLPHPTPFEMETALGFWYFREKQCDIVVLETGMGGLLDATNIVEHTCAAVITSISRDHTQFLGETLSGIAAHKAGILKKGCRAVTGVQKPEVMEVIREKAAGLGCPLTVADAGGAAHVHYGLERQWFDYGGYSKVEIGLAGQYQIENAVLALETLKCLKESGFPVTEASLRKGMARAQWPGRFAVIGRKPWFVADGAHNEDAAVRLRESMELYFPGRRVIFIMGMLKDKEHEKVIAGMHSLADQIITVTPPDNPRALPAYLLAREAAEYHKNVTAADSLEEAVEMSYLLAGKEDVILAFGSLSFMGRLPDIVGKRKGAEGKGNARGNKSV